MTCTALRTRKTNAPVFIKKKQAEHPLRCTACVHHTHSALSAFRRLKKNIGMSTADGKVVCFLSVIKARCCGQKFGAKTTARPHENNSGDRCLATLT